jgi:hypothetical protein
LADRFWNIMHSFIWRFTGGLHKLEPKELANVPRAFVRQQHDRVRRDLHVSKKTGQRCYASHFG